MLTKEETRIMQQGKDHYVVEYLSPRGTGNWMYHGKATNIHDARAVRDELLEYGAKGKQVE